MTLQHSISMKHGAGESPRDAWYLASLRFGLLVEDGLLPRTSG
ncbi:MAG: hypothetical protein RIE77_00895 [Phycisphaerales bacterium]|jgi:hypothetical protein